MTSRSQPLADYPMPTPSRRLPLEALEAPGLVLPPSHPGGAGTYAFHELAWANPHKHWWRPLATAAIGLPLMVLCLITLMVSAMTSPEFSAISHLQETPATPKLLTILLLSVAPLLPCFFLAQVLSWWRPLGHLWSVVGRFRWRWFAICLAWAFLLQFAYLAVSALTDPSLSTDLKSIPPGQMGWLAIFIVLLPFQCAAEEFVFRGYLQQAIGTWLRHPAWAILLSSPFFIFSHAYRGWALVHVTIFALVAGWLTYRTGGLEASTAYHISNNSLSFGISLWVTGTFDPNATGEALMLIPTTLIAALFIVIVEWRMRRHQIVSRLTIPGGSPATHVRYATSDYRGKPLEVLLPVSHPAVATEQTGAVDSR